MNMPCVLHCVGPLFGMLRQSYVINTQCLTRGTMFLGSNIYLVFDKIRPTNLLQWLRLLGHKVRITRINLKLSREEPATTEYCKILTNDLSY